ncbi:MAG: lipopolysaccharide biosynthesis protein, partial [Candidatus Adlerbacteria bacterium]|nr:lipopolysaccharide biosynthesis protein [Candidatus Adlerbacteria bacterium]
LVASTAAVLSSLFVLLAPLISPPIHTLLAAPLVAFLFILFCTLASVSAVIDSVFLARRQTKFVLAINFTFSVCKILLPFLFITWGAFGIFAAAAVAQAIGLVLGIILLIRYFNYQPRLAIHFDIVNLVWRYSATNYLASVINLVPVTVLPIIIVNQLGAHPAAYYYIVMMIGNLLYTIPWATARALFAEGSNNDVLLDKHFRNSVISIASLITPSIVFLLLFGRYILQAFGADYVSEGTIFLQLVAISGLFVSVTAIFGSLFQVRKQLLPLITANSALAIITLTLSYLLLPLGLYGIGVAWLIGNTAAALITYLWYRWPKSFYSRARAYIFLKLLMPYSKLQYVRARYYNGKKGVILCYPEKPRPFHTIYQTLHNLGYKITNNLADRYDAAIHFEDATFSRIVPALEEISKTVHVINGTCGDISKKHVDKVFTEVFGYSSLIDPTTYQDKYVRKSNLNTTHDGKILEVPTTPEEGYIYQKLINSKDENGVFKEMRLAIVGSSIVHIFYRYRPEHNRFTQILKVEGVMPGEALSKEERGKILLFCNKFGLEYGELDVLRDADGRLYILDANNTPAGPIPVSDIPRKEYVAWLEHISQSLTKQFLEEKPKLAVNSDTVLVVDKRLGIF